MSTTRISGRRSAILPTLIIAAVLVVAFAIFTSFWTDRLWYQSMDFGTVFSTMLLTRIGLFVGFGLIMAALVGGNAVLAYRLRSTTRLGPPTSPLLERYRELLDARLVWVVLAVAVLVGLFAGGAAAGQVDTFLAWRHSTDFGVTDPKFGLDISFFVFAYPWWRFVASFLFTALVFATIIAAVVHYITGGLRFSGPARGGSGAAQSHLSVLVGLAVLVKGVSYWFDQYGLEIANTTLGGDSFTGINYTADNATVNAKLILSVIAGICALLFFANAVLRRWVIPVIGLTLLILSSIVLGIVYPGAVQYFSVRPDEPDKERDYIARNIAATRAAYGVDKVEITDYSAKTTATAGQLALRRRGAARHPADRPGRGQPGLRAAPAGPRLLQVRPDPGRGSLHHRRRRDRRRGRGARDGRQGHRGPELEQPAHRLHPRLRPGRRVRQQAAVRRRAGVDRPGHPAGRRRSTSTSRGSTSVRSRTDYSIVGAPEGSPPIELDTPGGGDSGNPTTYTYEGKGGVPIGSFWHRLLYAAKFADVNILLSDRVNSDSKIIYDRTPRERVQKAAPWLKVGRRPVSRGGGRPDRVDRGRLHHVELLPVQPAGRAERGHLRLPDHRPGHQRGGPARHEHQLHPQLGQGRGRRLRRHRQAVRLGRRRTRCCRPGRRPSPGTVLPKSEISADLREHLRYPQDMFKVQRSILARYHMTDPYNWYLQSGLWEVPERPGRRRRAARPRRRRTTCRSSGRATTTPIFSLTSVYVPAAGRTWPRTWR